jgi:hypothetical protein
LFVALPPLVLAAPDIGNYIWLAVIVLSFLSWLVKLIKGQDVQGGAPAAPPRRVPPADKPLRSEIEVFLQELTQTQPKVVRKADAAPQPPPRKPPNKKGDKQRKAKPAETVAKATQRQKPGSSFVQQHIPTSQLGQGLRTHLDQYMAPDRVTAEAQHHIGHRIEAAVKQDLGQIAADGATRAAPVAHPLLATLMQPGGMRQALVLNEILQKPAALRRGGPPR